MEIQHSQSSGAGRPKDLSQDPGGKPSQVDELAFSYSVLTEVSRKMNTFLTADEILGFILDIITECAGLARGMVLVYYPSQRTLAVKCCKFFALKAPMTLESVSSTEFQNLQFRSSAESLGELELSGAYLFTLDIAKPTPLIVSTFLDAFRGLRETLKSLKMEVMLLLVHRGTLKGIVFMGEPILGSTFHVEDNLLLLALADLSSTCLETILARELAIIDDLSKLLPLDHCKNQLEHEIARFTYLGERFALITFGVDNLKAIREECGHLAGDNILRNVLTFLRNSLHSKLDLLGRYDGDTFIFLLPHAGYEDAIMVAEQIRSHVAQIALEKPGRLTSSVGMTFFPSHGATADELIGGASKALDRARQEGGNKVVTGEDLDVQEGETAKKTTAYHLFVRDRETHFYIGPYFLERLQQEMYRAKRYSRPFALTAFGLSLRERLDNAEGQKRMDELLRILYLSIITQIRKELDIPTRYAKETVLLLLPETRREGAVQFAARIKHFLRKQLALLEEKFEIPRLGVAVVCYPQPTDNEHRLLEALLKTLDRALEGRGDQIGIYDRDHVTLRSI